MPLKPFAKSMGLAQTSILGRRTGCVSMQEIHGLSNKPMGSGDDAWVGVEGAGVYEGGEVFWMLGVGDETNACRREMARGQRWAWVWAGERVCARGYGWACSEIFGVYEFDCMMRRWKGGMECWTMIGLLEFGTNIMKSRVDYACF